MDPVTGIMVGSAIVGAAGSLIGISESKKAAKDAKKQLDIQRKIAAYQAAQDMAQLYEDMEMTLEAQMVLYGTRSVGLGESADAIMAKDLADGIADMRAITMNQQNINRQIDLSKDAADVRARYAQYRGLVGLGTNVFNAVYDYQRFATPKPTAATPTSAQARITNG